MRVIAMLELNGAVPNAKALLHGRGNRREPAVVQSTSGRHEMHRHDGFGRAHDPDVEVVYGSHARHLREERLNVRRLDVRRHRSIARLRDSFRSPHVPAVMITPMATLTTGSIHRRP